MAVEPALENIQKRYPKGFGQIDVDVAFLLHQLAISNGLLRSAMWENETLRSGIGAVVSLLESGLPVSVVHLKPLLGVEIK